MRYLICKKCGYKEEQTTYTIDVDIVCLKCEFGVENPNLVYFQIAEDSYISIDPKTKKQYPQDKSIFFDGRAPMHEGDPKTVTTCEISQKHILKGKEVPITKIPQKWLKKLGNFNS